MYPKPTLLTPYVILVYIKLCLKEVQNRQHEWTVFDAYIISFVIYQVKQHLL